MNNYDVNFLHKTWVQVSVKAENENDAQCIAEEIIKGSDLKNGKHKIGIVDGAIKYVGIINVDAMEELDK